jgi:hypothetical protein
MIRVFVQACKALTQGGKPDDPALGPICPDLGKNRCPRCRSPHLKSNGSYKRQYVTIDKGAVFSTVITVFLARCKSCGSAHALLSSMVVPYSPFSVIFIANLIMDRLEGRFPSIEALCEHYGIAVSTYYRVHGRFCSSVKIACGIMSGSGRMRELACILSGSFPDTARSFLASFFEQTNTSFCQPRAP